MEEVDQHNHPTDQHKKKLYDAHEHDLKFHVEKKTLIIWVRKTIPLSSSFHINLCNSSVR